MEKFNEVVVEKVVFPTVKSYCKSCRATTAEVIGESFNKQSWRVRCPLCKAEWCENKEGFKVKYLGAHGKKPLWQQTMPPQALPHEWSDTPKFGNQLDLNTAKARILRTSTLPTIQPFEPRIVDFRNVPTKEIPDEIQEQKIQQENVENDFHRKFVKLYNEEINPQNTHVEEVTPQPKPDCVKLEVNGICISVPKGTKIKMGSDGNIQIN